MRDDQGLREDRRVSGFRDGLALRPTRERRRRARGCPEPALRAGEPIDETFARDPDAPEVNLRSGGVAQLWPTFEP